MLAHELGHFARGHIPRLLAVRFALALLLLAVLGWLYREPAFYQALGMTEPHIGAALAGFALVVPVFTFPFQPLASSLIARKQEFEADAYRRAARLGRGPRERARQALPRQRRHAHARSAAFAGV